MDQPIFFNEQDVLGDDLEAIITGTQGAIENRSEDQFGIGGFISGGVVTPNGGNPLEVDMAGGIFYDSRGRRLSFSTQTAIVVPDLSGGNNWLLVSIPIATDTPVTNPVTQQIVNTRQHDVLHFEFKNTFTQGDTDGSGNPFVPVALVTRPGGVGPLVIQDERRLILNLAPNTVDTAQIVEQAVIIGKLANYLKKLQWIEDPGFFYDKEINKLNVSDTNNGTFFLPQVAAVGFSVVGTYPLTCTQRDLIIGTLNFGTNTCTVSVITNFMNAGNLDSLDKNATVILGYIDINLNFVPLQAPSNGEIVESREEGSTNSTPKTKLHENLWRRFNEPFQSFTPLTNDGTPQPSNANQLQVSGGNLVVKAGVSYVAGRRYNQLTDVTLGAGNTENFSILTGTASFDIYIMRNLLGGGVHRFNAVGTGTPVANGYLIGTIPYVTSVPGTPTDKRVNSPIPQVANIISASQMVRVGARLENTTQPTDVKVKIVVRPGLIGFADGVVRQNLVSKVIDFTAFQATPTNIATQSLPGGFLQTQQGGSPLGLEPFSHYAIFAVADHPGTDFNVIAVKVPFFRSVTGASLGGGQYAYTVASPGAFALNKLFYPGQKIRATRADYTGPQYIGGAGSFPGATEYTQDNTNPEVIVSVIGNVITTNLGGNTALTGFSGGTITSINKLRPDPILTGIQGRYRLLGFVSSDGTAIPNTVLRPFMIEGNKVLLPANGAITNKTPAAGSTSQQWNLDMANWIPCIAKIGTFNGIIGFTYDGAETGGASRQSVFIAPGVGMPGGGNVEEMASQIDPRGETTVSYVAPGKFKTCAAFKVDCGTYMGFVQWGATTGPTSRGIWTSSFYGVGYVFDPTNEWGLQTITAGIGGFVP